MNPLLTAAAASLGVVLLLIVGPARHTIDCRPQRARQDNELVLEKNYSTILNRANCGYKSCPKTDHKRLNVHIIAHTHDDVGWLKTVDQYYYGTGKRYSQAGVQYIMDSVVPQLLMDKSKRFIYVEMSFFTKWWAEQDEQMRAMVRHLVNEGRLEFINGGWCMNDEATVTYHSTIEQMTLGLKFLNETFGQCGHPKVGWQIDPFGHTNEQASLFAQFGFDGMFFTRIGYQDKIHRTQNKSLDLIWHGDRALQGQSGSIFTNIFRDGYDAPNGFCFDSLCKDDAIVDNKNSFEYNADEKGQYLINFIRTYAKAKLTNHLLIPFGGDFQFTAAGQNFKSIDKMIKYIRLHAQDINIFYSTPSCYQYAVHNSVIKDKKINLPEKYDDFMPYDSSATVWWSGYFSSRPSVKLVERETANLLQTARLISLHELLALAPSSQDDSSWTDAVKKHEAKCLGPLWEILGDLQHHDAVTGTEKQHVADDYVRRASVASELCARFIGDLKRKKLDQSLKRSTIYDELRRKSNASERFQGLDPIFLEGTVFCPLLNISQCDPLESDIDVGRFMSGLLNKSNVSTNSQKPSNLSHSVPVKAAPLPKELETRGVLITAYNPLARPLVQADIRLPCNGRCDLDKVQVIHVVTNETMRLVRLPVPSGVVTLPFRDSSTTYEILFYADLPPLASSSFVISDENHDEIVDEENSPDDSILITDESPRSNLATPTTRSRRIRETAKYEHFEMLAEEPTSGHSAETRSRRSREADSSPSDRVIVKFDMHSGVIVGLKRVNDGSVLNITQRFGYYFPDKFGHKPGAYIFRPNSSEPRLLHKPVHFRMYKRHGGALIEIHQKWSDWIWQTIRVDAKKNYIEFDYVVGPIPQVEGEGREVITRYQTNMANSGVFLTDSNARQLLPRRSSRRQELPSDLGGSFYPVVSTMMIRNYNLSKAGKSAEAVSVLVDRAQAGTSLNEGDLELLIHRRHLNDDAFGVDEALNEPGEDGRGLVTRGRHRLYLKFHDLPNGRQASSKVTKKRSSLFHLPTTPHANLQYERNYAQMMRNGSHIPSSAETYLVSDQLLNDIRQESIKYALKPILTFDRLRVSAREFVQMVSSNLISKIGLDFSLLNTTLPSNIHLLTLQPWNMDENQLLIRLENLDNPLTLHPLPDYQAYTNLLQTYTSYSDNTTIQVDPQDPCDLEIYLKTEIDVEHLLKNIRLVLLDEHNLGANVRFVDDKRLDWTQERASAYNCDKGEKPTLIALRPRQIRTFLATFEYI